MFYFNFCFYRLAFLQNIKFACLKPSQETEKEETKCTQHDGPTVYQLVRRIEQVKLQEALICGRQVAVTTRENLVRLLWGTQRYEVHSQYKGALCYSYQHPRTYARTTLHSFHRVEFTFTQNWTVTAVLMYLSLAHFRRKQWMST